MAQACLTALDTWRGKEWRDEQRERRDQNRRWRQEDIAYRWYECARKHEERQFRAETRRWHHEILSQRLLDNSLHLWARQKEANRRDVEEKAEHMRAMSWIAAIVGGFVFTAPVEFSYSAGTDVPESLRTIYAVTTALVPSLMLVAAMIAVYLLGTLLRMGKVFVSETEEEEFVATCRQFAAHAAAHAPQGEPEPGAGDGASRMAQGGGGGEANEIVQGGGEGRSDGCRAPPYPQRTFEGFWESRCEEEWKVLFGVFALGVTLFFPLLCTMAFIKFFPNVWIPAIFSAIAGISLLFWLRFYFSWGVYLTHASNTERKAAKEHLKGARHELTGTPFDWHIRPTRAWHRRGSALSHDWPSSRSQVGSELSRSHTRDRLPEEAPAGQEDDSRAMWPFAYSFRSRGGTSAGWPFSYSMRRHDPAGVFGTKDGDEALSEEAANESPEDAAERFGLSQREEEGVQEAGA